MQQFDLETQILAAAAQLEGALAQKSKAADNLVNSDADIQEVLDHRDLLLG